MVMWQILIGRALKAWNNQLLRPVRWSTVHTFLSKKAERRKTQKKDHAVKVMQRVKRCRIVSKGQDHMLFSQRTEWGQTKSGFIKSLCSRRTSSLKFRDLWHFDPVALWLYDPLLSLGVSEGTNCTHSSFKMTDVKPTSGTDFKKTHQSFFELQCQLSTLIQSHMSGDAHVTAKFLTHCVIWHSPEARKLQRRKTGKNATAIFNLPFSRKKKNAEALLPGTALGQGSRCACTHIHARTHNYTHTPLQLSSVLRKQP